MSTTNKTFINHDFSSQDLRYMHFEQCCFYQCDFNRADLTDVKFIECNFIEQGNVDGCIFEYANLRDASFKHCRLSMSSFAGANCLGIEFRSCDLKVLILLKQFLKIKYLAKHTFAQRISQAVTCLMQTLQVCVLKNVIYLKTAGKAPTYKALHLKIQI